MKNTVNTVKSEVEPCYFELAGETKNCSKQPEVEITENSNWPGPTVVHVVKLVIDR